AEAAVTGTAVVETTTAGGAGGAVVIGGGGGGVAVALGTAVAIGGALALGWAEYRSRSGPEYTPNANPTPQPGFGVETRDSDEEKILNDGIATGKSSSEIQNAIALKRLGSGGASESLTLRPANSQNYSVVAEAQLKPGTFSASDANHFRQGNRQLYDQ